MRKQDMTPEERATADMLLAESRKMVRDISEAVYRERLGPDDVARMLAKDKANGETTEGHMLRERAESYDSMTRSYLKALGMMP